MEHSETIVDLLLTPGGGRAAAAKTLDWLLKHFSARCIGMWEVKDELTLCLSANLDQDCIALATAAWARDRAELEAERTTMGDGSLVVPAKVDGTMFLVVLDGLSRKVGSELEVAAAYARVAAKVYRHGAGTPHRPEEIKRDELRALLVRESWNIAKVSRLCSVSRKTMYEWMNRYHIQRERA